MQGHLNEDVMLGNEEEILGVTIGRKLTFHQYPKKILKLSTYLDTNKRKTVYTTMVKSQFNYCPLVWMFCPRR